MVTGPSETFTPEQLAALYDTNVLGTQRLNRAALPRMRAAGDGLLVWVSSSSSRGGTPPYLGPYFAAKAGMDALTVSYAGELTRSLDRRAWRVHPGNQPLHAQRQPDRHRDRGRVRDPLRRPLEQVSGKLAEIEPPYAEVAEVVNTEKGHRPLPGIHRPLRRRCRDRRCRR